MIVKKFHEIISFKQSKWLERDISFSTQKPNKAKNEFEKYFHEVNNNAFFGKMLEKIHNRLKIEFFKKNMNKRKLLSNNQN